jgi:hypothetical protein
MVPPIAILHKETVIMKLFIVAIFFSSLFLSCGINTTYRNIENKTVTDTQRNIKKKAEQLKKAYQKLSSSSYTKKYEQEYLEAFQIHLCC